MSVRSGPDATPPPELTPAHIAVLERLRSNGFALTAFPLYPNAIGIRRDCFAALLLPIPGGGLRLLGEPHYLIDDNLSVRVERQSGQQFVWKGREVPATPELLIEFARFVVDLAQILLPVA
jgi:hypothetical protein